MDLRGVNIDVLIIAGIIIAIAILTKLVGCGLPSMLFLKKDKTKSMRVGIGMVSRGEVGLIVAGVGVTSGVSIYRHLYFNNHNGSSYNNHYTHMVEKVL